MAELLNVPYSQQKAHGYCLPAYVQMVFAYLGIARSQDELARALGLFADFGVPASHLLKLRSKYLQIQYETEGNVKGLRYWLERKVPVILFVQTVFLDYWQGQIAQHALLLIGIDEQAVYLLDPAKTENVVIVAIDEFLLA